MKRREAKWRWEELELISEKDSDANRRRTLWDAVVGPQTTGSCLKSSTTEVASSQENISQQPPLFSLSPPFIRVFKEGRSCHCR